MKSGPLTPTAEVWDSWAEFIKFGPWKNLTLFDFYKNNSNRKILVFLLCFISVFNKEYNQEFDGCYKIKIWDQLKLFKNVKKKIQYYPDMASIPDRVGVSMMGKVSILINNVSGVCIFIKIIYFLQKLIMISLNWEKKWFFWVKSIEKKERKSFPVDSHFSFFCNSSKMEHFLTIMLKSFCTSSKVYFVIILKKKLFKLFFVCRL